MNFFVNAVGSIVIALLNANRVTNYMDNLNSKTLLKDFMLNTSGTSPLNFFCRFENSSKIGMQCGGSLQLTGIR